MKPLELVKSDYRDGLNLPAGYDGLVQSFEVETLAFATTGSYQGDMHYLLRDPRNGEYAYLVIGYGSCSGCDWMEASDGQSEAEWYADRDGMWNGLVWMTKPKMQEWLNSDARKRDFSWFEDEPEFTTFLTEARAAVVGNGVGNCPSCMIPDCVGCWGRGCEHDCTN